jgi:chaperonin GroES
MKLVPLEDRVLVEIIEQEQVTPTGIVLPDTAKEKPSKGRVVAVGPGKYTDKGDLLPMPVKEGDLVVFAKYAGTELKLDGEDYLVLRGLTDIIGVIPGE